MRCHSCLCCNRGNVAPACAVCPRESWALQQQWPTWTMKNRFYMTLGFRSAVMKACAWETRTEWQICLLSRPVSRQRDTLFHLHHASSGCRGLSLMNTSDQGQIEIEIHACQTTGEYILYLAQCALCCMCVSSTLTAERVIFVQGVAHAARLSHRSVRHAQTMQEAPVYQWHHSRQTWPHAFYVHTEMYHALQQSK